MANTDPSQICRSGYSVAKREIGIHVQYVVHPLQYKQITMPITRKTPLQTLGVPVDKMICFHNPEEPFGFLSNWYISNFEIDGVCYSSLEQYMMHMKALLFGDTDTAARILETDDPGEIKALGRQVALFDSIVWAGRSQIIVYRGLLAKFSQDEQLARMLDETGNAMLVECAYRDRTWACGRTMDDPARLNLDMWKGKNLLGFALMEVRDQLRKHA